MSTEHEGGFAGSDDRPEPTAGDSVAPAPDVRDAAVADGPAVAPPVDPGLSDFPPPSAAQPQLPPVPPAPVAPAAPVAPVAPTDAFAVPAPPAPPYPAPQQPGQYPQQGGQYLQQGGYPQQGQYPAQYPQPGQPPYGYPQGQQPLPYGAPFPAGSAWPPPRKKRRRVGLAAVLVATAVLAGGIGGGIGSWLGNNSNNSGDSASVNPKALSRSPESIAGIAAKSLPSVVTISASNSQESGTGTGFIFNSQGYILTNNHVVAPSTSGGKLSVKFSDGNSYPATIVGRAEGYDVAVIKINGTPKEKLVPLPLGNSDAVAVGDTTIAIGAPFGLSGTVTSGIISAKNRPVASGESGVDTSYMNALQTDASINPGNSGGPLMNSVGQVIGIDSAIQSAGATDAEGQSGSVGLGFAIPINQAEYVAAQLIKTGQPIYPIIGILRDNSYTGNGAKIASSAISGTAPVTAGGPAAQAGLQPGDVITEFDGVLIDSGPTLVSEIWSLHPGAKVPVVYTRNGVTHTTELTLGQRVGDDSQ
ncbi:S1C family serine protease [Streptacidiphilus albus]|uniref:S1C family serine protease n=1 Tax=Streptacidiphilus albus TaxID=105425 RepID=UPI000B0CA052|nr:trypsin-like peptidase domain-containing protein [Streptacidiphilus albus]